MPDPEQVINRDLPRPVLEVALLGERTGETFATLHAMWDRKWPVFWVDLSDVDLTNPAAFTAHLAARSLVGFWVGPGEQLSSRLLRLSAQEARCYPKRYGQELDAALADGRLVREIIARRVMYRRAVQG